jgi:hypothetical protein
LETKKVDDQGGESGSKVVKKLTEVAFFFNVSPAAVNMWKLKGMPGQPGAWDLDKIAAWKEENIRKPQTKTQEGARWSAEYKKMRAIRESLLVAKMKESLVSREKVDEMLTARAIEFRQSLEQLARSLPSKLVGIEEERKIHTILMGAFGEVLDRYSRMIDEDIADA